MDFFFEILISQLVALYFFIYLDFESNKKFEFKCPCSHTESMWTTTEFIWETLEEKFFGK